MSDALTSFLSSNSCKEQLPAEMYFHWCWSWRLRKCSDIWVDFWVLTKHYLYIFNRFTGQWCLMTKVNILFLSSSSTLFSFSFLQCCTWSFRSSSCWLCLCCRCFHCFCEMPRTDCQFLVWIPAKMQSDCNWERLRLINCEVLHIIFFYQFHLNFQISKFCEGWEYFYTSIKEKSLKM